MLQRFEYSGLLGINGRNADYIMQCNPRPAYPLVDNKVLTKRLAAEHGIGVPFLYQLVEYHGDLKNIREKLKGRQSFVVKPARGWGGGGILLVTERISDNLFDQNGELIPWPVFNHHLANILSGVYSLGGLEDQVLIEELVHPDPVFAPITYEGIPDIRIIVYRGIPAMAMLRLPTLASNGKANLHRGAIGAGIEISTGLTLTAVQNTMIISRHPDTGHPVSGIQVPCWEQMLRTAASLGDIVGLGYIGVDLLLDRQRGPLLLEINARPGLSIQIANMCGLKKRLELIDLAPAEIFNTPETRVKWALTSFPC